RRLFEHLQQSIGRNGVHGPSGVQHSDTPAAPMGGRVEPVPQGAQLIDSDFARRRLLCTVGVLFGTDRALLERHRVGPYATQVWVAAACEPSARRALFAGEPVRWGLAKQARRCSERKLTLAYAC